MSKSRQQFLGAPLYVANRVHLTATNAESPLSADSAKREAFCTICGWRVTVKDDEYGHALDCPHSIGKGAQNGDA